MGGRVPAPALAFAVAAMLVVVSSSPASAQGGPPLLTDDPDTPGPGYWEINLSVSVQKTHLARRAEVPRVDVNYGLGHRIQLKLEGPWLRVHEEGLPAASGLGRTTAGVKWRFLGEEHRLVAWSVYPQLEWSPSHALADRGLEESGRELLLPTELTIEIRHFEFNIELGRAFVQDARDTSFFGWSTEFSVRKGLELLAEVHAEWPDHAPTEVIVNAGARHKLSRKVILMAAVGRSVGGSPAERTRLLVYGGVQLNLPHVYVAPKENGPL